MSGDVFEMSQFAQNMMSRQYIQDVESLYFIRSYHLKRDVPTIHQPRNTIEQIHQKIPRKTQTQTRNHIHIPHFPLSSPPPSPRFRRLRKPPKAEVLAK